LAARSGQLSDDPFAIRDILSDSKKQSVSVMSLIRFPTMTMQEVAAKVVPTQLFDPAQLLELYTYLGLKMAADSNPSAAASLPPPVPGDSIAHFNFRPRYPRAIPFNWSVRLSFAWRLALRDACRAVQQQLTNVLFLFVLCA
jgi:hypothetical protein